MLLGVFFFSAVFIGLLLAGAPLLLILALAGVAWLLLLPYHAPLAVMLATITFASALIVPGLPGRPFVWEVSALLGWTGVAVILAMRQHSPDAGQLVRRNWPLFVGALAYCAVLFFLMNQRGVGLRVFGGDQIGGRIYFQQLACAIFPFLFAVYPVSERRLLWLFGLQCALSATFIVADAVFASGNKALLGLLYFLELPNDGINFETQAMSVMGIRRFQSLYFFALAMLSLLWTWRPFSDYFNRHGLWMWPVSAGLLAMGLLGGHRYLVFILAFIVVIGCWAQRFFTPVRTILLGVAAAVLFGLAAANIRDLPLAAQRALSVVPGLEVDRQAEQDGRNTLEGRKTIRQAGLEVSKNYRWIGRGFGKPATIDFRHYHDLTWAFVDWGVFYNGTVGLLVNTGLPGTAAMFLFLIGGTIIAVRVLLHARRFGAGDAFTRMGVVLGGTWIGNLVSFVFFHGDSEFAMRTFSLQGAMLLLCDYHLSQRLKGSQPADAAAPSTTAVKFPIRQREPDALPEPQTT